MSANREIFGDYIADVVECILSKLDEIKNEHTDLLEELKIDFDKTVVVSWNHHAVWFADIKNHPIDNLPYSVHLKVDLVIASCLEKYSSNAK